MRILVFGDSIAQGFWDSEGGWVQRLRRSSDAEVLETGDFSNPEIFNLSISGDTVGHLNISGDKDVSGLISRIGVESRARVWKKNPLIHVIAMGLNDSAVQNGREISTLKRFRSDLDLLADQVADLADDQLWLGFTSVDETHPNVSATTSDVSYSNQRIWEFELTLRKMCEDRKLPFLPLFTTFSEERKKHDLLFDGLHPNDDGHQFLANLIGPKLRHQIDSFVKRTINQSQSTSDASVSHAGIMQE